MKRRDAFPAPASARYPWDEILNGEVWELTEGEDFTSRPSTLISNARLQAKRRNGNVRTRLFQEEETASVVLQFVHE